MNKKTLLIVLVIVLLVLGGYYYWKTKIQKSVVEQAIEDVQKTTQSVNDAALQGVLPAIDTNINPIKNAPDTNPYSNTNPFLDVKVNPFE